MTALGHSRHSRHPGVSGSPQERTFTARPKINLLKSRRSACARCRAVRDSTLVAWYRSLYAPRTGGAYDSHHRTAGIAGCTRRRNGGLAARGAGAASGGAGDRFLHARSPNFASPDHWTPRRVSEIIPPILAGSKVRHPIVLAISVNWLTHARSCVLFA